MKGKWSNAASSATKLPSVWTNWANHVKENLLMGCDRNKTGTLAESRIEFWSYGMIANNLQILLLQAAIKNLYNQCMDGPDDCEQAKRIVFLLLQCKADPKMIV